MPAGVGREDGLARATKKERAGRRGKKGVLSRSSARREFADNNWIGPLVVFAGIGLMVLFFLMRLATTDIEREVPDVPVLRGYPVAATAYPRGALGQALPPAESERLKGARLEWLLRWPGDLDDSGITRELLVFPDGRRALSEFDRIRGRQLRHPGQAAKVREEGRDLWFVRGRMLAHALTEAPEVTPEAVVAAATTLDRALVRTYGAAP